MQRLSQIRSYTERRTRQAIYMYIQWVIIS